MKIVVAYKWASNPQDATVGTGGTVDWSRAKPGISEYDPAAVELARGLADATGGEVIGLTAGTKAVDTTMARKTALSRRFDRAVIVADDSLDGAGSAELATVLAAAVRHIGDVDLVITGDSSIDGGGKMVPTVLAGAAGLAGRRRGQFGHRGSRIACGSSAPSPAAPRSWRSPDRPCWPRPPTPRCRGSRG